MAVGAARESSPDMAVGAARESSLDENFFPLIIFKVLPGEEPESSGVGEQKGNLPLKEAEEKRYLSLDMSPDAQKPGKYKYLEEKSQLNSTIQKTEQWLGENPPGEEPFDASGHLTLNGRSMRVLSQENDAERVRWRRPLPSKTGWSKELLDHNGYLLWPMSQTPGVQRMREQRNKTRNRNQAVWDSKNPKPLNPNSAQKKVLELLAKTAAEKKAREKEPGTSEKEAEEKRYLSLDMSPDAQKPRKYEYLEEKGELNSTIQKTEQWLGENPPGAETFDASGHLILDGRSMRVLSQENDAKRRRQHKPLPSKTGWSKELLAHNGYLLRPMSQTPGAQKMREKRNNARNRNQAVWDSKNPKPLNPNSAQKKVLELLAKTAAEKKAREKEPGTSELPPEFPECMQSRDIPDDI